MKWKIEPQQRMYRVVQEINNAEKDDLVVCIGFDAGEPSRVARGIKRKEEGKQEYEETYPLYEWDWDREDCLAALKRVGLPDPGKSACFMCPSSKKKEIFDLATTYPNLFEVAVEIERRALAGEGQAPATTSKGLGRQFSWGELVRNKQPEVDFGTPEIDCGCYDG